jgi:hypothetical protein
MTSVTRTVKESLLGTTPIPELSNEARTTFLAHAQEGEDGEMYMDKEGFIDAIAPEGEDYVCSHMMHRKTVKANVLKAQDPSRAVWNPLPGRRSQQTRQDRSIRLVGVRQSPYEERRRICDCVPHV